MVLEIIKNRQSVRQYKQTMPSEEQINSVIQAGLLAPSFVNVQPWHFVVVKDEKKKASLSRLANNQPQVENAPVVIVCCGNLDAWNKENYKKILQERPNITPERIEQILTSPTLNPSLISKEMVMLRTVEQVTYAMSYMTIEATAQGLGTCILGGIGNPLTLSIPSTYKSVKEELKLPENTFIVALLTLGFPADDTILPKSRRSKSETVSYF